MIGTILNAAGIAAGGIAGLVWRRQPSASTQLALKNLLGFLTAFAGLRLTWINLSGGLLPVLKQLAIAMLAMILGRIVGRLLHLQKGMNWLGRYAKDRFSRASSAPGSRFSDGLVTCTVLLCAAPLALFGSIQDGLGGHWGALGVKAVIDGLAIMAFVGTFGWSAVLAVVPVVAFQGTVTLAAGIAAPSLHELGLVPSIHAVGGLLVFTVALLVLELRRIEWADYLPSLLFAPLLTWLWR